MKAKVVIPSSEEFAQKGNSRIFVQKEEDVQKVKDIIEEIDSYEFNNYMPKELVTVFNPDSNELIHNGKFDIKVKDLIKKCQEADIYVVVYSCNDYKYEDGLTLERAIQRDLGGGMYLSDFVYNKTKNF